MSLVLPEQHQQFQHILRLLNTNVDGKRKIMYALTEIKGVGRRYSNIVCKKADVDLNKRYVPFVYTLYLYVRLSDYLLISFFKLQILSDLLLDLNIDLDTNLNLNMVLNTNTVLVISTPMSLSELSPSCKTPLSTKSPPTSLTDKRISSMARTRKSCLTLLTPSSVMTLNV